MATPKIIKLKDDYDGTEIQVVFHRRPRRELTIMGWYNHGQDALRPQAMSLREFLDRLGITEEDVREAI